MVGRYLIVQKLGWGHFSTVWLAKDLEHSSYVALKVQKSAHHYLEAAFDEVSILNKVSENAHKKEWIRDVDGYKRYDRVY